jgi:hypothetical protein
VPGAVADVLLGCRVGGSDGVRSGRRPEETAEEKRNVQTSAVETRRLRQKEEARQSGADYRRLLAEMESDLNVDARLLLRSWTATMIVYENELPEFYRAISLVDLTVLLLLLETTIALTFDGQTASKPAPSPLSVAAAAAATGSTVNAKKGTESARVWRGDGDDADDGGGEEEAEGKGYLEDYHLEANLRPLGLVEIFYVCLLVTKNVMDLDEEVMLRSNASAFSPEIGVTLANYYAKYEMQRVRHQESRRPYRTSDADRDARNDTSDANAATATAAAQDPSDGSDSGDNNNSHVSETSRARRKRRQRDITDKFLMQRAAMLRALTSLHLHALDVDKPLGSARPLSPKHHAINCDAKIVAAVSHKLGRALQRSDYHYNRRRDTLLFS